MLDPGELAPNFPVGDKTLYSLLEGRSGVVFFFPRAFTAGWTKEAGGFRREYENLTGSGAEVIGVSPDPQETSDKFRESLKLPFPLVGDPEGRITKAYRVRWPLIGLVKRVTYVIGPHKEIRIAFHSELQPEAHATQACQALVQTSS